MSRKGSHLTSAIALLTFVLGFIGQSANAQTVSIISTSSNTEASLVEAAMKRYLRAEGYLVKGSTNEGIVLLVSVMRITSKAGMSQGLAGHVTVVSVGWQEYADSLVSESCKPDHELAQSVNDYLGTRLILHTSRLATGPDAEGLAEMLVEGVNPKIRETALKIQKFFDDLEKQKKDEQSKEVINPYR